MNEENTTIMPPEKQIVQDDRDARAEELESAFSYDGYQVVRKELFAHVEKFTSVSLICKAFYGKMKV